MKKRSIGPHFSYSPVSMGIVSRCCTARIWVVGAMGRVFFFISLWLTIGFQLDWRGRICCLGCQNRDGLISCSQDRRFGGEGEREEGM